VGYFYARELIIKGDSQVKRALLSCAIVVMALTQALTSLPANAGETYYRWTDDRGRPVHSDRPPPKGVDYDVASTGSTLIRPVEAEQGAVPAEISPRVGNDFEQVDTRKETEIEKNPEYCQRARDNLATLSKNGRIRLLNDQGEHRYIDEEEKEIQRQNAADAIDAHCE
jgi:hypothetical protein